MLLLVYVICEWPLTPLPSQRVDKQDELAQHLGFFSTGPQTLMKRIVLSECGVLCHCHSQSIEHFHAGKVNTFFLFDDIPQ